MLPTRPVPPRPLGLLAAVGVALVTLVLAATPALAHTALKSSDPAEGARLATAPTSVSLTFGEAVRLPAQPLRVTGPAGAAWTVGKATISGATVTFPVTAAGPAGAYTLDWSVVADDGDTVEGAVHFSLTAAAGPPTTAAPAPAPAVARTTAVAPVAVAAPAPPVSGGVPVWAWVVGGVVAVGIVAALVTVVVRRRAG